MINKLIEYSARNKFLVLLLIFFASAWGLWALSRVPLDAIPDLSDVQVIVFTEWPSNGTRTGGNARTIHRQCWTIVGCC